MGRKTKIEWAGSTLNFITGCTRKSTGCDNCYAVFQSRWLAGMGQEKYKGLVNPGKLHFNGRVKLHPKVLEVPLRTKKPDVWFVNSMSDTFHEDVPFEFIARAFAMMALARQHTFLILTKRPDRMVEYLEQLNDGGGLDALDTIAAQHFGATYGQLNAFSSWPLPNVWLGTSVEDQEAAELRIPDLVMCPAPVLFLSMEPLLEHVDLRLDECWNPNDHYSLGERLGWVICGGESDDFPGQKARPMHPDYPRSVRDQCAMHDIPFLFKQWGAWLPWEPDTQPPFWNSQAGDFVDGHCIDFEEPGWMTLCYEHKGRLRFAKAKHVGKKKAGRLLDGKEHNARPPLQT